MTQQNLYPSDENDGEQLSKKLILLYLINKFDIPLSHSHITQFALDEGLMNYYQVQTYLQEMIDIGYLDKSSNNQATHFTVTDDGVTALDSFIRMIPNDVKNKITKFAVDNRKTAKKDFDSIANHFYDRGSNEFIVKCGVYEDEMTLMELHLSVVSKEQALAICNNWKANVSQLYQQILGLMLQNPTEEP